MLFTKNNNMQWRHQSLRIALRDINKKGIEIGERQNRCHDHIPQLEVWKNKYVERLSFFASIHLQTYIKFFFSLDVKMEQTLPLVCNECISKYMYRQEP